MHHLNDLTIALFHPKYSKHIIEAGLKNSIAKILEFFKSNNT